MNDFQQTQLGLAVTKKASLPGQPEQNEAASHNRPVHRHSEAEWPSTLQREAGRSGYAPSMWVLRLNEVMELTGLGKATIYQLQRARDFPHRVKMTAQAVGWERPTTCRPIDIPFLVRCSPPASEHLTRLDETRIC